MAKALYQVSTAAMLSGIQKLQLRKGDILVVSRPETLHYLEGIGKVVDFIVPLVYAPGGIQSLSRQDLLNLLEQIDQQDVKEPFLEGLNAPI